jgi:ubiquinone/menaquinone biosynthesis C-methylase UbiE
VNEATTLEELRQSLRERLAAERCRQFGNVRRAWAEAADEYFWEESPQQWRLDILRRHGVQPGMHRILDLASGCGQFVLLALQRGYLCEGVEPDPWRVAFVARKIALSDYPLDWRSRFHGGKGEVLPFADDSFDYVTSFQTLEHVEDPLRVVREMVRVTKPGGAVHIMCPDYRSTFEAHYQLPWLPLMPKSIARLFLRLARRPTLGLETIQYTTRPRVLYWLREAEGSGRFLVSDEDKVLFENALRRRRMPDVPFAYGLWNAWRYLSLLGRQEVSVSMLCRIVHK